MQRTKASLIYKRTKEFTRNSATIRTYQAW